MLSVFFRYSWKFNYPANRSPHFVIFIFHFIIRCFVASINSLFFVCAVLKNYQFQWLRSFFLDKKWSLRVVHKWCHLKTACTSGMQNTTLRGAIKMFVYVPAMSKLLVYYFSCILIEIIEAICIRASNKLWII